YSATNPFTWTTTGLPSGYYALGVWVEDQNSSRSNGTDAFVELPFSISGAGVPPPCSNLQLSSDAPSSSITAGTVLHVTASASCPATGSGSGSPVYKWWVGVAQNGTVSWTPQGGYSSANPFTWNTTGLAAGTYYLGTWVEDQTSSRYGGTGAFIELAYRVGSGGGSAQGVNAQAAAVKPPTGVAPLPAVGPTGPAVAGPKLVLSVQGCGRGDVQCSGHLSVLDALCILRSAARMPVTPACPAASPGVLDVNGDGQVNAVDALCTLRLVAGLQATAACPTFPLPAGTGPQVTRGSAPATAPASSSPARQH
ncbi:MAG: hypothetical protein ACR2PL_08425, partial [Dehalococcoidia bacterium]